MADVVLFVDTETSGMVDFRATRVEDQPFLVQLAAILTCNGKDIATLNTLIQPDDWEIEAGAEGVHGISLEDCQNFGIPLKDALFTLCGMSEAAGLVVAHNIGFDHRILSASCFRAGLQDIFFQKEKCCTMHGSTDICKLPGRYGSYKWPKLMEAHQHFYGCGFEGAHDALEDVRACKAIYKALLGVKQIEAGKVSSDTKQDCPVCGQWCNLHAEFLGEYRLLCDNTVVVRG